MMLSDYVKFEDGKTKIKFREPTVADCCKFDKKDLSIEQIALTEFLDYMQDDGGAAHPSALWTEQERITAFWYIYVQSRDDRAVVQTYDCAHCGKEHKRVLDLALLADTLQDAKRSMSEPVTILGKDAHIVPLRGEAMEHLEQVVAYRDSLVVSDFPDEAAFDEEYMNAEHEVYLYRIAHMLVMDDEDMAQNARERAEKRLDMLLTMPAKEFKKLAAKVRLASEEMRHGLLVEVKDARTLLVTPDDECPNQEGAKTRLMLPFHFDLFVPRF